jgi:hypothetical protein
LKKSVEDPSVRNQQNLLYNLRPGRVRAGFWHFKFAPDKEVHNSDRTGTFTTFDATHKKRTRRNKQQKAMQQNESVDLKAVQQFQLDVC